MTSLTDSQKLQIASNIEIIHSMDGNDFCEIGEVLGYEWNSISSAIQDASYYAEDGDGAFTVSREKNHNGKTEGLYSDNEIVNNIMIAIFESIDANKVQIVN